MVAIYWSSTILVSLMLAWSAYGYIFHKATIDGVRDLGFPDFFRIQLAVLCLLATAVLLIPQVPLRVKEWAYAGVALFFITSFVAHVAHKDPIIISLINIFFLGILIVSNSYLHKVTQSGI